MELVARMNGYLRIQVVNQLFLDSYQTLEQYESLRTLIGLESSVTYRSGSNSILLKN